MDGFPSVPPATERDRQAASGGPLGVPWYQRHALDLLQQGNVPIPIRPGQKVPAVSRWSKVTIDEAQVEQWIAEYPSCGIGLRTGRLVGVDIDVEDDDVAWQIGELAQRRLGPTLMRVGRWPKRLLLYRTEHPFPKIDAKPIEALGEGQQFVAFGMHPGTGRPYDWPLGETPLEVTLSELPPVDQALMMAFVAEAHALLPTREADGGRQRVGASPERASSVFERNTEGLVTDGRDGWLSRIAFHAVHDVIARSDPLDAERLADLVWDRFAATTDLGRGRQGASRLWDRADALRKVCDKLRLHDQGALPERLPAVVEPASEVPSLAADDARQLLDAEIAEFCDDVLSFHADETPPEPRRLALKATTGLGKSTIARRRFVELRKQLTEQGLPDRFLVFVPSHALAEETAEAWRGHGLTTAVLRGYPRMHPVLKAPVCRDLEAINAAIGAGLDPQTTICKGSGDQVCRHLHGCLKQLNRDEVRSADVVVAPYDALFTGFAVGADTIAAIIVDEACWQRASSVTRSWHVSALTTGLLPALGTTMGKVRQAARRADHEALRQRLQNVCLANGPGPIRTSALAGLTAADCAEAIKLEYMLLENPHLTPGLTGSARETAFAVARDTERLRQMISIWTGLRHFIEGGQPFAARLRLERHGDDLRLVTITASRIDAEFAGKPLLHLDATLRETVASRVLPGIETRTVEAAAPHMQVHLVTGRFGKSAIVPDGRSNPDEQRRRQTNLTACVDHVRWIARRLAPDRMLVVTYKSVEARFADIPGVETGHFNAMAGLDGYGDVADLVIVGRPLPSSGDLAEPAAGLFDHVPTGSYSGSLRGLRMRGGSARGVRTLEHEDDDVEPIRSAICDDELIQCIGRGRGVNRTTANPLEVHVLADVALPLVYDSVSEWEAIRPDVFQRMLLASVGVDSPADAAALHADLFVSPNQAKLQFGRIGFKGQTPISIYKGMTLKSAAYRRGGRGRSWQRAYWLAGGKVDAKGLLEQRLGSLAGWDEIS